MKRLFWFLQLVFAGWGLMFFVCLHLIALVCLRFPESFVRGGIVFFGIGLIPMWMITVFGIVSVKRKDQQNWLDGMIAEFPNPKLTNKIAKIFWFYSCLFFGLALMLPESGGIWIDYFKAAGVPGLFMAFYGAGFLCALANWRKCDPSRKSFADSPPAKLN